MRWSKVRKLVEASFADSVRGRVAVHVTNADPRGTPWQDTCKRGWIQVDGETVAQIEPHHLRTLTLRLPGTAKDKSPMIIVQPRPEQAVPAEAIEGDFLDLADACWDYLHSSLDESLNSSDPFVSSLAVLNAKVGRQRLQRTAVLELHPLTRAMLEFRVEAEKKARRIV